MHANLASLSEKRRASSEKFQKRDAAIKKIIERKARHAISLNEQKFRAETVSEDENKDEAKAKPTETSVTTEPPVEEDSSSLTAH